MKQSRKMLVSLNIVYAMKYQYELDKEEYKRIITDIFGRFIPIDEFEAAVQKMRDLGYTCFPTETGGVV